MIKTIWKGGLLIWLVSLALLASYLGVPQVQAQTLSKIAWGSKIHGANGIYFNRKNQLYIASAIGNEIVVMDSNSGEILKTLGLEQGVKGPDDVVFGPDDSLYWTSILTGEVGRLTSDGTLTTQFVSFGVNPIVFSGDGRLFVGTNFEVFPEVNGRLYELDPQLVEAPRLIGEGLGAINGMAWSKEGLLYAPIQNQGKVIKIDVNRQPVGVETVVGGFQSPVALKFDSQNRLHLIDFMTGEIWQIDVKTKAKQRLMALSTGIDNIAFNASDQLFVSSARDGFIANVRFNGSANEVNMMTTSGMIAPGGIALMPQGTGPETLFIADFNSLRKFNTHKMEKTEVYSHEFGVMNPFTVSPYGQHLVLSSFSSNLVQVWDPATETIVKNYDQFAVPTNAIEFEGNLIVAELGFEGSNPQVLRMGDGDTVTLASAENELYFPVGLAATNEALWVSDRITGMVWQIAAPGKLTPVAMELSDPEGLAVDIDGNLLVVEVGKQQLSRIDLTTGAVTPVIQNLPLGAKGVSPPAPPSWIFNDVTVGPQGRIYLTGDLTNELYRSETRL